jgi:hypothetical protein
MVLVLEVAVEGTVLLPTADVVDAVEREILPVVDSGLFVEYRRRRAVVAVG